MTSLTVVIAPPGLEGVCSVLHDWAAVGLVDDFVWVQPGDQAVRDVDCLQVHGDRLRGTTLRVAVADSGVEQVQVCSVVPLFGDVAPLSTAVEQRTAELLAATGVPLVRARLVIALPGGPRSSVPLALAGWNNFVLSPEERTGPRLAGIAVTDADPARLDVHVAQSVAGLLGLWAGVEPPARDWQPVPGEYARLVSTYYRRLVGDEAENSLRHAVMSMDQGLPRPRRHGVSATYVPDPRAAAGAMAESWWMKHRSALHSHREELPQVAPQTVKVGDALRHFFSYLAAALRNAPGAWLARLEHSIYSTVAKRVSDAVYGSGSAYTVVVKGLTGDGRPAGVADVRAGAAEVDAALQRAGFSRAQEGHPDNGALWSDFVDGALTLADGNGRVADLPPITVGADLGVVKDPGWIAPTEAAAFHGVSPQLATMLTAGEVHSYDPLAVADLERQLDQHGQMPGLQFEVSSARAHLQQWKGTTRASYADEIAGWIQRAYDATRDEINRAIDLLQEASGADRIVVDEHQRSLSRRVRGVVLGTLLGVLVAIACIVVGVLGVLLGVIVGAVILVGGLLGLFITFFRGQKRLFQLLNQRRALDDAAQVATKNLQAALRDLGRITGVYAQLQLWVPVLARFLAEPFGRPHRATPADVRLAGPFTRNAAIGKVQRDVNAEERGAAEIRHEIFTVGWLADPWQRLLDSAGNRLRPDEADQLAGSKAMYRQPAVNSDGTPSVLARWSETVVRDGTLDERAADRRWAEVITSLRSDRAELARALTAQVRVVGDGSVLSRAAFLGVLDTPGSQEYGRLDSSLLGDRAATHDQSRIVTRSEHRASAGLSEVVAMVDYSTDIPAYEFGNDGRTSSRDDQRAEDIVIPRMPSLAPRPMNEGSPLSNPPGANSTWRQR